MLSGFHIATSEALVVYITSTSGAGGWWRWALVCPDGVAPSRMVGVSASVNLPLHHKVQTEVLFWHQLTRVVQEKWP